MQLIYLFRLASSVSPYIISAVASCVSVRFISFSSIHVVFSVTCWFNKQPKNQLAQRSRFMIIYGSFVGSLLQTAWNCRLQCQLMPNFKHRHWETFYRLCDLAVKESSLHHKTGELFKRTASAIELHGCRRKWCWVGGGTTLNQPAKLILTYFFYSQCSSQMFAGYV